MKQNEIVEIKERGKGKENDNPNWKGWIFCENLNSSGWVPEQIINRIEKNKGLIKKKIFCKGNEVTAHTRRHYRVGGNPFKNDTNITLNDINFTID